MLACLCSLWQPVIKESLILPYEVCARVRMCWEERKKERKKENRVLIHLYGLMNNNNRVQIVSMEGRFVRTKQTVVWIRIRMRVSGFWVEQLSQHLRFLLDSLEIRQQREMMMLCWCSTRKGNEIKMINRSAKRNGNRRFNMPSRRVHFSDEFGRLFLARGSHRNKRVQVFASESRFVVRLHGKENLQFSVQAMEI